MSATAAAVQQARRGGGAPARAAVPTVPFIRSSERVIEGPFFDVSAALGAAAVSMGPFEVPARGFARSVIIEIDGSAGVLGAGVLHEDFPWNLLGSVQLTDPGGTPLYGPTDGYSLYLANFLGGYRFNGDPAQQPSAVLTINASYYVRIPIEVTSHDGFGSLVNENAAASYKLSFVRPASTSVFTTAPTTPPTIRYRGWLEAWADPMPADPFGNPLTQEPPAHGTIQYWTEQSFSVPAGQQLVKLTRVGNPIRALVGILRTAGVRTTANVPDPFSVNVDGRQVQQASRRLFLDRSFEAYGRALPAGVFVIQYIDDGEGHAGDEGRNLYRVTFNGTRMELGGAWGAASLLTLLTNDIAPVGAPVRPLETPVGP